MKSVRTTKLDTRTPLNLVLASSVADPGRFDADPDPTFQVNSDTVRKKNSFKSSFFSSQ